MAYLLISLTRKSLDIAQTRTKMQHLSIVLFRPLRRNCERFNIFHTDHGNELKNRLICEVLEMFYIKRSLSMKGCPYDNAVAEATFKIIKTEFIRKRHFTSLEELSREL